MRQMVKIDNGLPQQKRRRKRRTKNNPMRTIKLMEGVLEKMVEEDMDGGGGMPKTVASSNAMFGKMWAPPRPEWFFTFQVFK